MKKFTTILTLAALALASLTTTSFAQTTKEGDLVFQDYYHEGVCIVRQTIKGGAIHEGKAYDVNYYGLADKNHNIVVPVVYMSIESVWKNRALVVDKDYNNGIIDFNNNVIIPFEYDIITSTSDGKTVAAFKHKKWAIFSSETGKRITPHFFDDISMHWTEGGPYHFNGFVDGHYCPVAINYKWGYINEQGEVVIPIVFDDAHLCNDDGKYEVEFNGKTMYIEFEKEEK